MTINLERTVETEVGLDMLRERLAQWADLTAYSSTRGGPPHWEFRRGSWWHCLYSFDIRKWPTKAMVTTKGEDSIQVRCSIQFKCWWSVPVAEDERRLLEDLELLLAFVCEVRPSPWRMSLDKEVR